MRGLPLIKSRLNHKPPPQKHHHNLHLHHRKFLPNAIARPRLKRPPSTLDRIQWIFFLHEPALREKRLGMRPELRVVVHGVRDDPSECAFGGELLALVVDEDAGFAFAGAAGWWPEAERFLNQSCGVRESVQHMRIIFDDLCRVRMIGTEDLIAFGAEFLEAGWMPRERVGCKADCGGRGVVSTEHEDADV